MEPVTVITLADETYGMPLAVMVRSLLDHLAPGRTVRVVVIDGGITPATKQRLGDSWRGSAGWPFCQVDYVTPLYVGGSDLPVWGRVPALTYARLSAAEYVPDESRRVILLDSDTLVLTDIAQLAATDLEGATVAATQDPYIPFVASFDGLHDYAALGLSADVKYFNAGIMLIDLERWRTELQPSEELSAREDLARFAYRSGGYATWVSSKKEMSSAVTQLASAIRSPYLLFFVSPASLTTQRPLDLQVDVIGVRPRPLVFYREAIRLTQ